MEELDLQLKQEETYILRVEDTTFYYFEVLLTRTETKESQVVNHSLYFAILATIFPLAEEFQGGDGRLVDC